MAQLGLPPSTLPYRPPQPEAKVETTSTAFNVAKRKTIDFAVFTFDTIHRGPPWFQTKRIEQCGRKYQTFLK